MWNDICCCKCGSATSGFPSLVLACVFIVTAHAMTFIITIMMTIMMVNIEFNIWCHDDQHDSIGSDSLNCPLFGFWQKWQRFPNSEVFLENHIHCKGSGKRCRPIEGGDQFPETPFGFAWRPPDNSGGRFQDCSKKRETFADAPSDTRSNKSGRGEHWVEGDGGGVGNIFNRCQTLLQGGRCAQVGRMGMWCWFLSMSRYCGYFCQNILSPIAGVSIDKK